MEEENKNSEAGDFEMGSTDENRPKINNYMRENGKNAEEEKPPQTTNDVRPEAQSNVNPFGTPPPETPAETPPTQAPPTQTPTEPPARPYTAETSDLRTESNENVHSMGSQEREQAPQMTEKPQTPQTPEWMRQRAQSQQPGQTIGKVIMGKKPSNPEAKRKAILGCLGAFGAGVLLFLILAFVFIAQSGAEQGPIAKLLGINQVSFVNGLITFIHVLFVLAAIVLFIFTMFGLLKASTAKKDEKEIKKSGIRTSMIAGISLMMFLIIWLFAFIYLDTKRIRGPEEILDPIIASINGEVIETINLTAPVSIKFDASNVPYDAQKFNIISYRWDFGDGTVGTAQIVSKTYETKGEGRYDVVLSVTRRNKTTGEEFIDEYSTIVTIAKQALSAVFTADPPAGPIPLKVVFDAKDSVDPDGEIIRYEWDLNEDGEFDDAEGVTVENEFTKIGKYNIGLRITTRTGDYAITEREVEVHEKEVPEAVISITDEPETFMTGVQYLFNADKSTSPKASIENYAWDFGDGSALVKTRTATHSYTREGTFEIILIVTDKEGNEGEARKVVTVGAPKGKPKAIIETEPVPVGAVLTGTVPFTVVFDGSSSTDSDNNIVDYEWDIEGDGEADKYGALVSHTFEQAGTYNVTLSVIDSDDNVGKENIVVKVEEQGITAKIQANIIEGSAPLSVTFDASGSTYPTGQITSYRWNFGDGTSPKLGSAKITHKYDSVGTYTAWVEVIGSDNTTDRVEMLITVREVPLTACFTSVFEEGPAPLDTTFDPGCSTGTIVNYFWDFNDGNTSTSIKPRHAFSQPGTYNVTLEVSDSDKTIDRAQLTIKVN